MTAVIAVLVTIILILAAAILVILLCNHGVARPTSARLIEQKPGLVPDYAVLGSEYSGNSDSCTEYSSPLLPGLPVHLVYLD